MAQWPKKQQTLFQPRVCCRLRKDGTAAMIHRTSDSDYQKKRRRDKAGGEREDEKRSRKKAGTRRDKVDRSGRTSSKERDVQRKHTSSNGKLTNKGKDLMDKTSRRKEAKIQKKSERESSPQAKNVKLSNKGRSKSSAKKRCRDSSTDSSEDRSVKGK